MRVLLICTVQQQAAAIARQRVGADNCQRAFDFFFAECQPTIHSVLCEHCAILKSHRYCVVHHRGIELDA